MKKRRRRPRLNTATEEGGQFFPAVQKKLSIGKSDDAFETEADKMADTVVNNSSDTNAVQKMDKKEDLQQKPLSESISSLQKKDMPKEDESVQKMEEEKKEPVQKMEKEQETEPVQKMEEDDPIQQKTANTQTNTTGGTEATLKQQKGKGSKMDASTKKQMEQAFGADFSNVNIHTDSSAEALSQDLGAQAFTHGNDVYFNKDKYNPNSKEGKHLLAHELTHTIQQGGSKKRVQRDPESTSGTSLMDRMKELKLRAHDEINPMTNSEESEFISGLNSIINGVNIPEIDDVVVKKNPGLGKFKPKEIYFDKNQKYTGSSPAVTKPGTVMNGLFIPNKKIDNKPIDAIMFIGPNAIVDTISYTISVLEHEGVHFKQIYLDGGFDKNLANDEVTAYAQQFARINFFSDFEIESQFTQWAKYYAGADEHHKELGMQEAIKNLLLHFEFLLVDQILNKIPDILKKIKAKRWKSKEEAIRGVETLQFILENKKKNR